ncbi:S8 family serine peptidase [Aliikangiella coralliicola]|uniref:S8 family serine peptidase n=1 Tax=Aliikangiella coralliicola TaxID=2592383 RepID=A0A545UDS5_9GAMM|nr:S8 family serine peptidase [Aliikangiella coralliicola]TQV87609.1 S8 family serine peptidase [Aliikangiella coralliicola]
MKKQVLFILWSLIFVTFASKLFAQQSLNQWNQYVGVVNVKFSEKQTRALDLMAKQKNNNARQFTVGEYGYVSTGINEIDKRNQQFKVNSMERIFRPGGKYEARHRAHGLHLWYRITFDPAYEVNTVVDSYQQISVIEVANAVYEARISDGWNENIDTPPSISKMDLEFLDPLSFDGAPNDPRYPEQWHYHNTGQSGGTPGSDIRAQDAWAIETGDPRVIVAVHDTGIQVDHEDLAGNMWVNSGEIAGNGIDDDNNGFVDDVNGYNFNDDNGVIIAGGHGTHVAGTIAAETNNGIGVAGIAGGTGNNDGVRLMSCAIFGPSGVGANRIPESFVYAADNGAVISQNSWGGGSSNGQSAINAAIDYFIANAGGNEQAMDGGIVFFATGNDDAESNQHPGAYEPVVSVVATSNRDKRASYSNYHANADVAAPAGEGLTMSTLSTTKDNRYGFSWGTSMATPHVSGLAALVVSNNFGSLTSADLRTIIEKTTDPIDFLNPEYKDLLGSGRVNAYKALVSGQNRDMPLAVRTSNITTSSADLSWTSLTNASNFEIRYKPAETSNWITVSSNTTSKQINGLAEGEKYIVQVRAISNTGTSRYSFESSFTAGVTSLDAPANFSVSNVGEAEAELNWIKVFGAIDYEIRFKKSDETQWSVIPVTTFTQKEAEDLVPDTSYRFEVRSANNGVYSDYSSVEFHTTFTPCGTILPWQDIAYQGGAEVAFKGFIYRNKWYVDGDDIPGKSSIWQKKGACSGNVAPTVNITSHSDGQVIEQENLSVIRLIASASDSNGSVTSVQFSVNGTALAEGSSVDWLPANYGSYTIKVVATDNDGATAEKQITLTIQQDVNQLPSVSITSHTNGQIIEQENLTAITLTASATDSDGSILSVQFSVNGSDLVSGSSVSWLPGDYGNHTIKVITTDNEGGQASEQITLTLKKPVANDCDGVAAWSASQTYSAAGIEVSHNNFIYRSKWWTKGNEPGTGGPWGPWELVEPC